MKSGSASPNAFVTVVIPVKNGGERLKECLAQVFAQRTPFPFEVLCVDSGSTDDSLGVIRRTPARLIEIEPHEFGHGRTRNLAISQSHAPFVAMMTQDAVPADEHWLRELIQPLLDDENVAGVFGRHIHHPGCIPTEAYSLERHFANFGSETRYFSIEPGPDGWKKYQENKLWLCFFSDNNAAIRRSVWKSIPYADVEFMEDQMWGAAILEAGYLKAYAPRAVVRHSHDYSPTSMFRRAFDETRYFREYFDPKEISGLLPRMRHARAASIADTRRLLKAPELSKADRARWIPKAIARHYAQALGSYLGDRAPLLPGKIVRKLSQHHQLKGDQDVVRSESLIGEVGARYRTGVKKLGKIDAAAKVARTAAFTLRNLRNHGLTRAVIELRKRSRKPNTVPWWEAGVFRYLDQEQPVSIRRKVQHRDPDPSSLVLNWVLPNFYKGAGGHQTIFRIIHLLERRGHRSRVYILGQQDGLATSAIEMKALIHEWFAPIAAPVRYLGSDMEQADVVLATSWPTAYPVRETTCAPSKAYFIQDYEPLFHPAGVEALLAEDTYRFGFMAITAGVWLKEIMERRFGMTASAFHLAVEHRDYWPDRAAASGRRRVFAYMRPSTQRRAFELVALALSRLHREMPEVEIHIAGAHLPPELLPFPHVGHGVLDHAGLRRLFSSCDVAICASLTNYSLLPQEIAACGCPVVEVDVESTRAAYPAGSVVLAPPTVVGIASEVLRLLSEEALRQKQIEAGLAYAKSLSWEKSALEVEAALLRLVGKEGFIRTEAVSQVS